MVMGGREFWGPLCSLSLVWSEAWSARVEGGHLGAAVHTEGISPFHSAVLPQSRLMRA